MERKLAAIFSADVKGYSRLMGDNEIATVRTLTAYREVMTALIHVHRGRVVDSPGDNMLVEFASVVDAVQCAAEIQNEIAVRNAELPTHRQMAFRIGINVGDVLTEDGRLYGDGVNIAARLEGLADAGGICISEAAYTQVKNKLAFSYAFIGEQQVKNIAEPVRAYKVQTELEAAATPATSQEPPAQRPAKKPISRYWPRAAAIAVVLLCVGAGGMVLRHFYALPSPPSATVPVKEASSLPLPDKPSIIVLPFDNMSKDPEQDYFSDGITEDITTGLAKLSSLFVIARNSAFTYKGKAVKVQEVSREMGVQYVLEGSVRRADEQIRVTVQLIDGLTGSHLWAERFDRPLKDVFAVQDEIVQKIVTTLKLQLTLMEQGFLVRKRTDNLEAYDFYLRGVERLERANYETNKELNVQARQLLEHATELDSTYAEAYATLGHSYFLDGFYRWSTNPAQSLERAGELAQQASAFDGSLSTPHQVLGLIYLWKKQHGQALVEGERAVALNPNGADGYVALGAVLTFAGRPEEAIGVIEKAMRLHPRYRPIYLFQLSVAYRMARRYEEALPPGKKFITLNPNSFQGHFNLAVIYSELGQEVEAQAEVAEMRRIAPNFSLEQVRQDIPFKDPAALERHLAALRKAGLK